MLFENTKAASTAMERLATGSKINKAQDDVAGTAIADRMTSQVRGLNMAVKNVNDAMAMLSVADSAASDITDMLQRMRELAIQAASDTNSAADRQYLQGEVNSLIQEIDRVATQTQYNGENVIGGSKSGKIQVGSQANQVIDFDFKSLRVSSFEGLTVNSSTDSTESQLPAGPITDFTDPVLTQLSADKSVVDVTNGPQVINLDFEAVDESGLNYLDVRLYHTETGHAINGSSGYGANQGSVQLEFDELDQAGIYELGWIRLQDVASNNIYLHTTQLTELGINFSFEVVGGNTEPSTTNQSYSWSQETDPPQSSSVTPTGATSQSYSWSQEIDTSTQSSGYTPTGTSSKSYEWSLYNLGSLNITNSSSPVDAIASITAAIETITEQRAEYGTMQNRLQYTISNLMNVSEQTTAARSRIEDADFATESAVLAKAQVLQQSGAAMLAQANARPHLVLQLIK